MRRLTHTFPLAVALSGIGLAAFGATAYAASAVVPDSGSIFDLTKPLFEAFKGGHYAYAAALMVVVLVAILKKAGNRYLGETIGNALHSNTGGTLLALVAAMASAMAAGLVTPGAHVTFALIKSSFLVGVGAAGGYAVLKNLVVEPLLKPLQKVLPVWAQPLLSLMLWMFDKPVVADAEQKGQDAVDANPGQGTVTVLGQPTEVE
jgi:hypothetical protein